MSYRHGMSENLVDNFKNLIPFVGGGFEIDWEDRQPASYYTSSNPMSMDVNHGKLIVDCHLTGGTASQFSISRGVYILYTLADADADNLGLVSSSVSMEDKFRAYPALHVVFDEITNLIFEAPIISLSWAFGQYGGGNYTHLYCCDFELLVLRVA